ncbi:MAG: autotransporter-associated beta strand repeat-containing protein [Kiritimatiellia bacterium]
MTTNVRKGVVARLVAVAMAGVWADDGWNGQRAFTNDEPWTISSVLSGTEGLAKWGAGDLTLSAKSTFTGDVLLAGGTTLLTTLENDVWDTQVGALGNPRVVRTVVVSNATLRMVGQNSFGGSGRSTTPILTDLRFYDATLDLTTNFAFNAGNVYLHDTEVKFHGGLSHWGRHDHVSGPDDAAFWGSFFANNFYFSGTRAVTFQNEDTEGAGIDYLKAGISLGKFTSDGALNLAQQGVIDVPDMTGDDASDVILWVPIVWTAGYNAPCSGFRKTGAGTLELGQRDDYSTAKWSNYTGDVDVVEGTLKMAANYASIEFDRPSAFGAARYPHTFTVHPGATLWMGGSDQMGQFYATNALTLVVKGTYKQSDGAVNGLCRTIFDDATVDFGNGPGSSTFYFKPDEPCAVTNFYVVQWPHVGFADSVTFTGTRAYNLSRSGTTYYFGRDGGRAPGELHLDDVTQDDAIDLTIAGKLVDAPIWYEASYPPDEYNRRYITRFRHDGQPFNLRKTGAGSLHLANAGSTTTGRIEIAEGVLRLGKRGNSDLPATASALGNLAISNRTALVMSGGVLEFVASDTLGQAACVNDATIVVSNATLRSLTQSSSTQDGWANSLPFLELYDATFDICGGLASGNYNGPYGTFIFAQRVSWDGTRPYDVQPRGASCCFALGFQDDSYVVIENAGTVTNLHGKCEFHVADITRDARPDVTLGVVLKTQSTWGGAPRFGATRFWSGLLKTGPGTLRLNGTGKLEGKTGDFYYQEATRVNGGALLVDTTAFRSTNVFVQAGAFLGGTGTVMRATIEAGGGFTAAPGQTRALDLASVELPADRTVRLDVPCTEDVKTVKSLRVPVVSAQGLEDATWVCTVNGNPPPAGYRATAVVSAGVVYGVLAKSGLVFLIR